MKIIYSPEDGETKEYEFIPAKLISPEAEAIENVGGEAWDSFEEFAFKFMKGSIRAYRAALWVMMKRENPRLRFQDLVFKVGEVVIDFNIEELNNIKTALEVDDGSLPEDQRQEALSDINDAIQNKGSEVTHKDLKDPTQSSEVTDFESVPLDSRQV